MGKALKLSLCGVLLFYAMEASAKSPEIVKSHAPFGLKIQDLALTEIEQAGNIALVKSRLSVENASHKVLINLKFSLVHASDQITVVQGASQLGDVRPGATVTGKGEVTYYLDLYKAKIAPLVKLHWSVEYQDSEGKKTGEALIVQDLSGIVWRNFRKAVSRTPSSNCHLVRPNQARSGSWNMFSGHVMGPVDEKDGASGVDVVLVIDRSGSMEGEPVELAKSAARQFIDLMNLGDQIGVVSFAHDSSVDFPLSLVTTPGDRVFSDDFEAGAQNWTAQSPWARIDWDYHSSTHSWTDSPEGNYANDANNSLTLNLDVPLGSLASPVLSFWTKHFLEEGFDYGWVEISTDGGNTWATLAGYTGNSGWRETLIDLQAYREDRVRIRFRLESDYSITYDGWYIDDVVIKEGSTKDFAKIAIGEIVASGTTSIGAGLLAAYSELVASGREGVPGAIVLLSDGQENVAPWVDEVLPFIVERGIRVFAVGLGEDADEDLLMRIAERTGGLYRFSPSPQALAEIYNEIQGQIAGFQGVYSTNELIGPGETKEFPVEVDSSIRTARFTASAASGDIGLTLVRPDNTIIDQRAAEEDPAIEFILGPNYKTYTVIGPNPGRWVIRVTGDSVPPQGARTSITVQALTDLRLSVEFDRAGYIPGDGIGVFSLVRDPLGPILEASVVGAVTRPSLEVDMLELYDDGSHNDSGPRDGLYGAVYLNTMETGSYTFKIDAVGVSNRGERFMRTDSRSTVVGQDSDGDGMPDLWEDMYGLNKYAPDYNEDPDQDGLPNLEEYRHRTNPKNGDSDGDGYSDGDEVSSGSDPLDPNSIPGSVFQYDLTVAKVGPGSGTVISSPSGIDCGSRCRASFPVGAKVMLTANANLGSVFSGWSGDCSGLWIRARVKVDSDKTCVARFDWWPGTSCDGLY